jgi:hypothetical protein
MKTRQWRAGATRAGAGANMDASISQGRAKMQPQSRRHHVSASPTLGSCAQ